MARRAATTWLAKRSVWCPYSKGKSLQKVDRLIEIPYIFEENDDENPEVRVSVKDEGLIGKKMREAMLAKGKPIVLALQEILDTIAYEKRYHRLLITFFVRRDSPYY